MQANKRKISSMDAICKSFDKCLIVWVLRKNAGGAVCDCLDTFIRKKKKSKECVCADGFENKDGVCVDIDECADGNTCGENEVSGH